MAGDQDNVVVPPRRFGASTVVLDPSGWKTQLGLLADCGVEMVELCAEFGPESREVATFDYTDPYAVELTGAALREAGLGLHSIHGPIFLRGPAEGTDGDGPPDPLAALKQDMARHLDGLVESLCACIDACAALGGRFVVTQDVAEELPPEVPHLASREALSRLGDYAAEHGCVFAIENGAEDGEGFRRIVEAVHEMSHPGLGICLDTGHAQVWNYRDVPRAAREAGEKLCTCHVHDNLGMSDDHLPPGDGVIPWAAVIEELAGRSILMLELHSTGRPGEIAELVTRSMEFLGKKE